MAKPSIVLGLSCLLFSSLCFPSSAQSSSCSVYSFPSEKTFRSCTDLPALNSHIHWNYQPSTRQLDVGFRVSPVSDSRWIAWAINPTSEGMVGSQSFIAFRNSDGSMAAYTSSIRSHKTMLKSGKLSFPVSEISASFECSEMIIYATMQLPDNISTTINHVWQKGPLSNNVPAIHEMSEPNMQSYGSLNLLSGEAITSKAKISLLRKIHAIFNAICWGVLAPIGVIIARYLKAMKPSSSAWLHAHRAIQIVVWAAGILVGAVTGLILGAQSSGGHPFHRYIGISIMVSATLQVLAIKLRPDPDSDYRFCWNIYHHSLGYGTVVLGMVNVFVGLQIMNLDQIWTTAYVNVLVALGCTSVVLECFNCFVFKKRNSYEDNDTC